VEGHQTRGMRRPWESRVLRWKGNIHRGLTMPEISGHLRDDRLEMIIIVYAGANFFGIAVQ